MYSYKEIRNGVFAIADGTVKMYLICGEDRALLLDTGNGTGDLLAFIRTLHSGEIVVAHTHAHPDHIGCDHQFEEIYANEAEWNALCAHGIDQSRLRELTDGFTFDLGGRRVEAWHTPGHTEGSMSFLDWDNRVLFSGDNVSERPIYMCLEGVNLDWYKMSIDWLASLEPYFDALYGCHGTEEQSFERAKQLSILVDLVRADQAQTKETMTYDGRPVLEMSYNGVSMLRPRKE